jgi:two-component system, NtrC family, response regulator AtoC
MLAQNNSLESKPPNLNHAQKVLIIEDEVLFARAVVKRLQKAGFDCEHAENLADGQAIAMQFSPDLVLLDMRLPDGNGLNVLPVFAAKNMAVIIMTAHGEISDAVAAMKLGAIDYLKKPIDLEELLLIVEKNQKNNAIKTSLDYAHQRNSHEAEHVALIGESVAVQSARLQIERIAQISSILDATPPTVLITGETGTGKDVAARLLHATCHDNHKPFVHVDCASLPAELMESELFGHEKGAFTGANQMRPGLIEAAEDGTLFLDEIGELPLSLQAKLLNVLERRMVRRLGSTKERSVPARIIAATNRNLHDMCQQGTFRVDLYYRLNVMNITLAPLKERGDDILLLANHFMRLTEKRYGLGQHTLSETAVDAMLQYAWPGNVRELRHQISRAVLLSNTKQINALDLNLANQENSVLPANVQDMPQSMQHYVYQNQRRSQLTLNIAEKNMLLDSLDSTRNNVSEAARLLGITRMAMRYRMDKHGINL